MISVVRRVLFGIAFILIVSCSSGNGDNPTPPPATPSPPPVQSRSFELGFSTFPYDATAAAVQNTYAALHDNGDIYLEQFDAPTVPWGEALSGDPFPASFQDELDRAIDNRLDDRDLVVAVMPLGEGRDAIAPPTSGSLPPALDGKPFDDPAYIDAFTNYCVRIIDALDPDYFIAGLEVNVLFLKDETLWAQYVRFARAVRDNLKARYPGLPISESITLHDFFSDGLNDPSFRQETVMLLMEQDYTAVSYYPFLYGESENPDAYQQAFDLLDDLTQKPIAFTETGNIAERLVLPSYSVDLPGSPSGQADYIRELLDRADSDSYRFIINWTHRDYDALASGLPPAQREAARPWRDTGLFDENGAERPALTHWRDALARPKN